MGVGRRRPQRRLQLRRLRGQHVDHLDQLGHERRTDGQLRRELLVDARVHLQQRQERIPGRRSGQSATSLCLISPLLSPPFPSLPSSSFPVLVSLSIVFFFCSVIHPTYSVLPSRHLSTPNLPSFFIFTSFPPFPSSVELRYQYKAVYSKVKAIYFTLAYLRNHVSKLHQILCMLPTAVAIGRILTLLQYAVYFRFSE